MSENVPEPTAFDTDGAVAAAMIIQRLEGERDAALAQQSADPPYDPSCLECRRAAGKDAAGTTWQCVGHVYRERDTLRSERDEAREALEVEKTCRDRNWNDLKWVRQALDNECRLSETLTAQRDAALAERDEWKAAANTRSVEVSTWMRDAQEAQTALTEARRVLREVHTRVCQCPMCYAMVGSDCREPHAPACPLAAVLAQEETR